MGNTNFANGVIHTSTGACPAFQPEGILPRGPLAIAEDFESHGLAYHRRSNSLVVCNPRLGSWPSSPVQKCFVLSLTSLAWTESNEFAGSMGTGPLLSIGDRLVLITYRNFFELDVDQMLLDRLKFDDGSNVDTWPGEHWKGFCASAINAEEVAITGGFVTSNVYLNVTKVFNIVTKYGKRVKFTADNITLFRVWTHLPAMSYARHKHSCGKVRYKERQVLMIAGNHVDDDARLAIEVLDLNNPTEWQLLGD